MIAIGLIGAVVVIVLVAVPSAPEEIRSADAGTTQVVAVSTDAFVPSDAEVDAAVAVEPGPVDAGAPLDAAPRKAAPPTPPAEQRVASSDPEVTSRWIGNHKNTASAFDAWAATFPATARALYDADAKTGVGRDLVSWLHTGEDTTVEGYLAVKPQRALAALFARDPMAFAELAAWVHSRPRHIGALVRRGGGLPWSGRP